MTTQPLQRRSLMHAALATLPAPALAQGAGRGRPVRIGWLTGQREAAIAPYLGVFRQAMAEAGHVEGRNLTIEYRFGNEDLSRVPEMARELAALPVQVLMVQGVSAQVARLNLPVPVAYVMSADPVAAGLAPSLAQPGFNMTGLTFMAAELNGKRLELLGQIVPGLRRVAVLANPEHAGEQLERDAALEAGRRMGVTVSFHTARTQDQLQDAFRRIPAERPQALAAFADGFMLSHRQALADFALAQKLPLVSGWALFAEAGALCTYGPKLRESYRRLASYVDRMIRGAKPQDLPIERPTVFETVVNQRTARQLGLTLPPQLLTMADDVID